MNDITPPQPAKQDIQDNPELASNVIKTNVQPDFKTNVGRPVRHWGKWLLLILLILPLLVAAFYGIQQWRKVSKTYKIGKHSFTYGDVEKEASYLSKLHNASKKESDQNQVLKEASESQVMLAALKSEADKHNVAYDISTLDKQMVPFYTQQGGKQAYLAKMKSQYSMTEQDVQNAFTSQYLKDALEPIIIAKKEFIIVYVRWDGIKLFDAANYDGVYKRREAELKGKYLPLLQQGASLDAMRAAVELSDTADQATIQRVYMQTKNAPLSIQLLRTGNVSFESYKEGDDVFKKLDSLTKVGSTTGPFKGADGRLAIVRLEKVENEGDYHSWTEFLQKAKQSSGVSGTSSTTAKLSIETQRVVKALAHALMPKKAQAASELQCLTSHSVTYNVTLRDASQAGNPRLWQTYTMGAGASRLIRFNSTLNQDWCSGTEYQQKGFSVGAPSTSSSDFGFAQVGKLFSSDAFGYLTLGLDCWGPPWSIGPAQPSISGYTFDRQSGNFIFDSGSNGQTYDITFYYRPTASNPPPGPQPPPSANPYCKLNLTGTGTPSNSNPWSANYYNYDYASSGATRMRLFHLTTNRWGDWITFSGSGTIPGIVPASATDDGYSLHVYNNSTELWNCAATINSSQPPPQPPPPPVDPPPPTFGCNAAPVTADTSINPWVAAFDAIPRGSVPPPPSSITVEPGQPVYVLGYIQKGMNPRIPGYVYRWTIDPSANTSGPNLKGGYIDNKAFVSFNVTAPNEAVTMTYTLKADVNSEAGGIIESSCSAVIIVKSKPLAPTANPWLQTKRGNVLAIGYVQSQLVGSAAGRPATSADKEAEHVIMGYLGSTVKDSNFCSTMGYDFGTITANKCQYSNASGSGYAAKVPNGIGTSSDPAITSLNVAVTGRNGLATDTCNDKVPYKLNNLGTASTTVLGDLGASNDCPMVIYTEPASGTLDLTGNTNITQGRGTLYVKGNVTISGNISYSYGSGRFSSINTIPNLGIVATGNILIAPTVTNVDASLYALGKVKTCSGAYPSAACNVKLTIRGKLAAVNGFELGRSYWTGNPADTTNPTSPESAELVIGSGLLEAFPPPGFVDLTGGLSSVQYLSREANPRF